MPTDVEDLQSDVAFETGKFCNLVRVQAQFLQAHVAAQFRHFLELIMGSVCTRDANAG